jgi:hypothetical protein
MLVSRIWRARRATNSISEASSNGGSLSGSSTMEVMPPAAAAMAALSSVSLCSSPGSPVWTRASTMPGAR